MTSYTTQSTLQTNYIICNTLENSYGIKTKPKFNFRDK